MNRGQMTCAGCGEQSKALVDDLCPACIREAFQDRLETGGPVIIMQNILGVTVEVPYGAENLLARLRSQGYREKRSAGG